MHDGPSETVREIRRLIESAFAAPGPVEWNRHDDIDVLEYLLGVREHQRRERTCERSMAAVLEGLDHAAQRSLVETR